jgi:hypothetical protein
MRHPPSPDLHGHGWDVVIFGDMKGVEKTLFNSTAPAQNFSLWMGERSESESK